MRECHRRAPLPHNALIYYLGELFRDIAWSQHTIAGLDPPSQHDDLNKEMTEATHYAVWPEVDPDEWCGEWGRRR